MFGKHTISVEGSILCARMQGNLNLLESQGIMALADEVIKAHGSCALLVDNVGMGAVDPNARRFLGEWASSRPLRGVAQYHAGLMARTFGTLIIATANLMRKLPVPMAFFATEAEARAWLTVPSQATRPRA